MKQRGPLMGFELTTDRSPSITSQTRYPLHHAASKESHYNTLERLNSALERIYNI